MAANRHLSRIVVTQALFGHEFNDTSKSNAEERLDFCIEEFGGKVSDKSFASALLKGVLDNITHIHRVIREKAPEWPIEKIAPVDRAILEVGVFEILYSEDVPPVVAINEGIEVAKVFGNENSPKFINGVLSAVMHEPSYEKKYQAGKV